ncbi:MAG: bifunctional 2-keto-4-hydroxyglutarate aldolase/2-keto-3-deoxy-6-phosphogluconate aldolase [Bacilli bacterium]|jgi:2-dehydro-3-deoxyphosphogluconate aldolase/(4S)-4-hydroxy-2-oxoglutarate aldolase|nr:bifunctional 2-keto-4-hydroxyglutarate aldolase/2-keto-3-deoxy-6-phosphogluconate aldolase [Bacilli bacterium]
MKKIETLNRLVTSGVIAVIRGDDMLTAVKTAQACSAGGIKGLEITFTIPGADEVIGTLVKDKKQDYLVGAGTVLDAPTARYAILKGASFIVSPSFDKEVAEICNLYQVPYIAGCLTPTEVVTALKAGVDIVKVFPGSLAGPEYLKAIHGPLPQANLLPSGGVDLANVADWIHNGAVAVSAGSSLTAPAKTGDFKKVTEIAKAFVAEVKKAREGKGC